MSISCSFECESRQTYLHTVQMSCLLTQLKVGFILETPYENRLNIPNRMFELFTRLQNIPFAFSESVYVPAATERVRYTSRQMYR